MQLYSKDGLLFLVQTDHLCGEDIGEIIDRFYEAGAKNVQVLSSITKKNRPAYIILIDAKESVAEKIENIIVKELRSSGWHRIESCHRHTNVSIIEKEIKVKISNSSYTFTVRGKVIDDDCMNIRPEYDDCKKIKDMLREGGNPGISIIEIRNALEQAFRTGTDEVSFESKGL